MQRVQRASWVNLDCPLWQSGAGEDAITNAFASQTAVKGDVAALFQQDARLPELAVRVAATKKQREKMKQANPKNRPSDSAGVDSGRRWSNPKEKVLGESGS